MKYLLSLFTLFAALFLFAGEVQISLYPKTVVAGEPAELILRVNSRTPPEFIRMPDLTGVEWLGSATSQRYQYINGRSTRTAERRYSFVVERPGTYTIPETEVRSGNRRFLTEEFTFRVQQAKFSSRSVGKNSYNEKESYSRKNEHMRSGEREPRPSREELTVDDAAFSKIVFPSSKTEFYVGEDIPAEIIVYCLAGIKANLTYPELTSDKENLVYRSYKDENPQNQRFATPTTRNEVVNGRDYICYVFRTEFRAISPGKITLSAKTKTELRLPGHGTSRSSDDPFFDSFFNSGFFGKIVQHTLRSKSPELTIRPLPPPPAGSQDLGLVGNWKIESTLSALETNVGNTVTLTVKLEGNGGLENLKAPELKIDGFRIYTPEITRNPDGKSAEIRYIMIPTKPGTFDIKQEFSIFDTKTGAYKSTMLHKPLTVKSASGVIPVKNGPNVVDAALPEQEPLEEPEHELAGIMYLKRLPDSGTGSSFSFGTSLFFLLLGLLTFAGCEIRHFKQKGTDTASTRKSEAKRIRKKLMNQLKTAQSEEVYNLVPEISDYLNKALNLPPGTSMNEVAETLEKKQPDLAGELKQLSAGAWAPGAAVFSEDRIRKLIKMLSKVVVLVLCFSSFAAAAEFSQVDAMRAYDKGEFKTAREWYTAQLKKVGITPALLYNIGNCYYQEKEYAKAQACYERARILAPRDPEILRNLELAERETGIVILKKMEKPGDIPSCLMDQMTLEGWWNLAFFGIALLLAALGLRRFFSMKVTLPIVCCGLILLVLGAGMMIAQDQTTCSKTRAMIIEKEIPLRALPSMTAKTVSDEKLQAAEVVQIRESRNDWVRIQAGNAVGWVPASAVARLNGEKFSVF